MVLLYGQPHGDDDYGADAEHESANDERQQATQGFKASGIGVERIEDAAMAAPFGKGRNLLAAVAAGQNRFRRCAVT